jgi:hypothetical protein
MPHTAPNNPANGETEPARHGIQASWQAAAISERAAYRELPRKVVPRNVRLLMNGECEVAC